MKTKITILMLLALIGMKGYGQTQLWGTAFYGGNNYQGTIFTSNLDGTNFHSVYSMIDSTGRAPLGSLVLANNCKLYGVTEAGGCNASCVAYSYDPISGIYTDIHDFACDAIHGDGAKSELINASNGNLYGLCEIGGAYGKGVIYRIQPGTNTYSDIYDFANSTGSKPMGSLLQLTNGKLYGMTDSGGANSNGVIFSFNPNDSTYFVLHSFSNSTGINPYYGGLIKATDNKLYGMTYGGGTNNYGVIFSYDLLTNIYTDVHDFDNTNGGNPCGSLIQATNGLLYGIAQYGDANLTCLCGVIFSFDITTNLYTIVHRFNGTGGANSFRSLIQASNGFLYGNTNMGGSHDAGVLFNFNIINQYSGNFSRLD